MSEQYNTISSDEIRFCACGCGAHITGKGKSKSKFHQGHDQKFVSDMGLRLAGAMVEQDQDAIESVRAKMADFPNLEAKIESKAARTLGMYSLDTVTARASGRKPQPLANTAAIEKAERMQPAVDMVESNFTVKVGRWDYPAKVNEKGLTVRNTKRDGTGEWVRVSKQDVSIPLLNEALGL